MSDSLHAVINEGVLRHLVGEEGAFERREGEEGGAEKVRTAIDLTFDHDDVVVVVNASVPLPYEVTPFERVDVEKQPVVVGDQGRLDLGWVRLKVDWNQRRRVECELVGRMLGVAVGLVLYRRVNYNYN